MRTRSPSARPSPASAAGMDQRGRPALAGDARGRVVEAGVEKRARGRRRPGGTAASGSPSSMTATWSGKGRQSRVPAAERGPIGAEVELSCRHGRTRRGNARSRTDGRNRAEPSAGNSLSAGQPARPQCPSISSIGVEIEARMLGAEAPGEPADHLVVRAAFGIGRHDRAARAAGRCGRRRCRCRRVRGRSSPATRCRPSPRSRS